MNKNPEKFSSDVPILGKKEFSLSADERLNIESRQSIIKQYQYLIHVINDDIVNYVNAVICPRVGMKEGQTYKLTPDNTKIILEDHAATPSK